jgi:hypothetical protein
VQRNHADDVLAKVVVATRADTGREPLAFAARPGAPAGEITEADPPGD